MDKIEIKILNPYTIRDTEAIMVAAAKLTQRGHSIKSVADFMDIYAPQPSDTVIEKLCFLPHPTLQKFTTINVIVVGASRRFLQQITRHQNEVKFMSGSLQYSDYTGTADFVKPYDIIGNPTAEYDYIKSCEAQLETYERLKKDGVKTDDCGYCLPIGLRNVLLISATPYQWKHMIHQRICRRNSDETRYVMLKIWEQLYELSPIFRSEDIMPSCVYNYCKEGKMSCGRPLIYNENGQIYSTPTEILQADFSKIVKEVKNDSASIQHNC